MTNNVNLIDALFETDLQKLRRTFEQEDPRGVPLETFVWILATSIPAFRTVISTFSEKHESEFSRRKRKVAERAASIDEYSSKVRKHMNFVGRNIGFSSRNKAQAHSHYHDDDHHSHEERGGHEERNEEMSEAIASFLEPSVKLKSHLTEEERQHLKYFSDVFSDDDDDGDGSGNNKKKQTATTSSSSYNNITKSSSSSQKTKTSKNISSLPAYICNPSLFTWTESQKEQGILLRSSLDNLFVAMDCDGDSRCTWDDVYSYAINTTMHRMTVKPADVVRLYGVSKQIQRSDNVVCCEHFDSLNALGISSRHESIELLDATSLRCIARTPKLAQFDHDAMIKSSRHAVETSASLSSHVSPTINKLCYVDAANVVLAAADNLRLYAWNVTHGGDPAMMVRGRKVEATSFRLNPIAYEPVLYPITQLRTARSAPRLAFASNTAGELLCYELFEAHAPRLRYNFPIHVGKNLNNTNSNNAVANNIVTDFCFQSPLEHRVISTGFDKTVRVTDLHLLGEGHSESFWVVGEPDHVCTNVTYCESYELIVTASVDCVVRAWTCHATRRPATLLFDSSNPHRDRVVGLFQIPGTPQLISADCAGLVKVWDLRNFLCAQSFVVGSEQAEVVDEAAQQQSHQSGGGDSSSVSTTQIASSGSNKSISISSKKSSSSSAGSFAAQAQEAASHKSYALNDLCYIHGKQSFACVGPSKVSLHKYDAGAAPNCATESFVIGAYFISDLNSVVMITPQELIMWDLTSGSISTTISEPQWQHDDFCYLSVDQHDRRVLAGTRSGNIFMWSSTGLNRIQANVIQRHSANTVSTKGTTTNTSNRNTPSNSRKNSPQPTTTSPSKQQGNNTENTSSNNIEHHQLHHQKTSVNVTGVAFCSAMNTIVSIGSDGFIQIQRTSASSSALSASRFLLSNNTNNISSVSNNSGGNDDNHNNNSNSEGVPLCALSVSDACATIACGDEAGNFFVCDALMSQGQTLLYRTAFPLGVTVCCTTFCGAYPLVVVATSDGMVFLYTCRPAPDGLLLAKWNLKSFLSSSPSDDDDNNNNNNEKDQEGKEKQDSTSSSTTTKHENVDNQTQNQHNSNQQNNSCDLPPPSSFVAKQVRHNLISAAGLLDFAPLLQEDNNTPHVTSCQFDPVYDNLICGTSTGDIIVWSLCSILTYFQPSLKKTSFVSLAEFINYHWNVVVPSSTSKATKAKQVSSVILDSSLEQEEEFKEREREKNEIKKPALDMMLDDNNNNNNNNNNGENLIAPKLIAKKSAHLDGGDVISVDCALLEDGTIAIVTCGETDRRSSVVRLSMEEVEKIKQEQKKKKKKKNFEEQQQKKEIEDEEEEEKREQEQEELEKEKEEKQFERPMLTIGDLSYGRPSANCEYHYVGGEKITGYCWPDRKNETTNSISGKEEKTPPHEKEEEEENDNDNEQSNNDNNNNIIILDEEEKSFLKFVRSHDMVKYYIAGEYCPHLVGENAYRHQHLMNSQTTATTTPRHLFTGVDLFTPADQHAHKNNQDDDENDETRKIIEDPNNITLGDFLVGRRKKREEQKHNEEGDHEEQQQPSTTISAFKVMNPADLLIADKQARAIQQALDNQANGGEPPSRLQQSIQVARIQHQFKMEQQEHEQEQYEQQQQQEQEDYDFHQTPGSSSELYSNKHNYNQQNRSSSKIPQPPTSYSAASSRNITNNNNQKSTSWKYRSRVGVSGAVPSGSTPRRHKTIREAQQERDRDLAIRRSRFHTLNDEKLFEMTAKSQQSLEDAARELREREEQLEKEQAIKNQAEADAASTCASLPSTRDLDKECKDVAPSLPSDLSLSQLMVAATHERRRMQEACQQKLPPIFLSTQKEQMTTRNEHEINPLKGVVCGDAMLCENASLRPRTGSRVRPASSSSAQNPLMVTTTTTNNETVGGGTLNRHSSTLSVLTGVQNALHTTNNTAQLMSSSASGATTTKRKESPMLLYGESKIFKGSQDPFFAPPTYSAVGDASAAATVVVGGSSRGGGGGLSPNSSPDQHHQDSALSYQGQLQQPVGGQQHTEGGDVSYNNNLNELSGNFNSNSIITMSSARENANTGLRTGSTVVAHVHRSHHHPSKTTQRSLTPRSASSSRPSTAQQQQQQNNNSQKKKEEALAYVHRMTLGGNVGMKRDFDSDTSSSRGNNNSRPSSSRSYQQGNINTTRPTSSSSSTARNQYSASSAPRKLSVSENREQKLEDYRNKISDVCRWSSSNHKVPGHQKGVPMDKKALIREHTLQANLNYREQ